MKKPIVALRILPGRLWLLVLLILLAAYGAVCLSRREQSIEVMAGAEEALPPQGLFETVCRLWEE